MIPLLLIELFHNIFHIFAVCTIFKVILSQLCPHVFIMKNCSQQYNVAKVEDVVKNNKSLFVNCIKMWFRRKLPELQFDCKLQAFSTILIRISDQDMSFMRSASKLFLAHVVAVRINYKGRCITALDCSIC